MVFINIQRSLHIFCGVSDIQVIHPVFYIRKVSHILHAMPPSPEIQILQRCLYGSCFELTVPQTHTAQTHTHNTQTQTQHPNTQRLHTTPKHTKNNQPPKQTLIYDHLGQRYLCKVAKLHGAPVKAVSCLSGGSPPPRRALVPFPVVPVRRRRVNLIYRDNRAGSGRTKPPYPLVTVRRAHGVPMQSATGTPSPPQVKLGASVCLPPSFP